MMMQQISSLAQDAFNADCELDRFCRLAYLQDLTNNSSLGVTQWGYGHHSRDLPAHIRSSPTPLKVSSSYSLVKLIQRSEIF